MRIFLFALIAASVTVAGCFEPPAVQPPPASQSRAVIGVPYDLTWNAIHDVVRNNNFKIQADDPDHGILEAEAASFSLKEADCGQIQSIVGRYNQEPDPDATAVYRFTVKPSGPNASVVAVSATFSAPVHVPFHRPQDFQCVSRGKAEARLLKAVEAEAQAERRPNAPKSPSTQMSTLPPIPDLGPLTPGRPTLLRPGLTEPKLQ